VPGLVFFAWVWRRRGGDALRAELGVAAVVAALASFGAYALVLLALDLDDAAPVAAVRETSVVIAVALAAVLLRERVPFARAAGSAVVVGGILVLALG
jgi:drug/metabolite transporter (DMT)-like permease